MPLTRSGPSCMVLRIAGSLPAPRYGAPGQSPAIASAPMQIADALEVVRSQHHAVMATTRADGRPQLSPVSAGVLDDHVVVSSRETAMKVANLRRRPYGALCVF